MALTALLWPLVACVLRLPVELGHVQPQLAELQIRLEPQPLVLRILQGLECCLVEVLTNAKLRLNRRAAQSLPRVSDCAPPSALPAVLG